MSTKSKLLAKTGDLYVRPDSLEAAPVVTPSAVGASNVEDLKASSAPQFPGVAPGIAARTGPGQMLQFRGQMLAVEGELATLRGRLKEHEGSMPTRKLDPRSISTTQWANRHPDAFRSAEFERLKQDILASGGNIQAICVRPAGSPNTYEVVFGHRRHRACAELGLPVLAAIETAPISDRELFATMDRENRERADLSPYEQGLMYRRALDAGLYPSNRRLAEALGVSHTWVSNVLQVSDLPPPILECFRTPIEVQHRHAKVLAQALESDRKGVLRRAEKLRQSTARLAPGAVVAALVKAEAPEAPARPQPLQVGGKTVGSWRRDGAGRLTIQVGSAAIPDGKLEGLLQAVAKALAEV